MSRLPGEMKCNPEGRAIGRLALLLRSGDKRDAEILALRHQILVLQRQIDPPRFTPTDRTILAVLSRAFDRPGLRRAVLIAKPAQLSRIILRMECHLSYSALGTATPAFLKHQRQHLPLLVTPTEEVPT